MSNFFAYLSRMKFINRWSLMRSVVCENIMEHSEQVAILAHGLCVIGNVYFGKNYNADRAVTLAVFHDASEVITGDMPTPIKYSNSEITAAYKNIENIASGKLIGMLPEQMQGSYNEIASDRQSGEARMVKCADKLAAYIKCLEERATGNKEFLLAESSIKAELFGYKSLELDYFMEHFIAPYSLTLDELNK
ncbi:MAG: 5'-deoxynucleotidase [Clostridia bacterium]|nr:5'-deoxynucleotidase [Clostridia bacterium]